MTINKNTKTVLFAPLNWGLGHTTRLIPIIKQYQKENWNIILASDGLAYSFLQKEFPQIKILNIGNPELKYSKQTFVFSHLKQLIIPFFRGIKNEHKVLQNILLKEKIDLIISDNRYGFWNKNVKSILLTHQLNLPIPFLKIFVKKIIGRKMIKWINNFDECWVIDNENHSLAGELSYPLLCKTPIKYIGLQSRFQKTKIEPKKNIDYLIILSGLEPHRQFLENKLINILKNCDKRIVMIGGHFTNKKYKTIRYIPIADTLELQDLLQKSKIVIARSGYSTIMDLIKMEKKAILIPTPGQLEQEYLAQLHKDRFDIILQKDIERILTIQLKNC